MKAMRIAALGGLLALGACGLYMGTDGTERHKPTLPDAGHGPCGGGPDGGGYLPDAGVIEDGGSYLPDGGWSYDGGGYLPDAWVDPAPDAH